MNQITLTLQPTAFTTTDTDGSKRDRIGLGDIVIPFTNDLKKVIPFADFEPMSSGKALRTKSAYTFYLAFSETGRAICLKCEKASDVPASAEVYSLSPTPAATPAATPAI
jgi:hypothetical protein